MIRFLTAGESHGKCLNLILEGVPAGLHLPAKAIDRELQRRQKGYGRGGRMRIEKDRAEITAGVRNEVTLGSPIAVTIQNRDWENWSAIMSPGALNSDDLLQRKVTRPRPGHADLAGGIKYRHEDLRNVLERASARETAARVAAGSVAKRLLDEFEIYILSFVLRIGNAEISDMGSTNDLPDRASLLAPSRSEKVKKEEFIAIQHQLEESPVRCPSPEATEAMTKAIETARSAGDSLGGVFQVVAFNMPVGLGSHVQWDRRLDARIAFAIMSIPAIKGVEIGLGFEAAKKSGSQVHDEIYYDDDSGFYRKTNNAGGTEGGISNGQPLTVKAAMKPIPSLSRPLRSVDMASKEPFMAVKERADVCAVPAAGIVGEAVVALEIANAMLEKFGGDSLPELHDNFEAYMKYAKGI